MSVKLLCVLYKDCETIAETFGDSDPRVLKVSEISWCHMSRSTFRRLSNKSFGGEYLKCFGNVTCLAQSFGNLTCHMSRSNFRRFFCFYVSEILTCHMSRSNFRKTRKICVSDWYYFLLKSSSIKVCLRQPKTTEAHL